MRRPYVGPYVILEFVRPKVVDLRHEVSGQFKRVNVERIKPFLGEDPNLQGEGDEEPEIESEGNPIQSEPEPEPNPI